MTLYHLSLNQAALIFFPAEPDSHLVQVIISTLRYTNSRFHWDTSDSSSLENLPLASWLLSFWLRQKLPYARVYEHLERSTFNFQQRVVESLIAAYISSSTTPSPIQPHTPVSVTLNGKGYHLIGRTFFSTPFPPHLMLHGNLGREEWKYGKGLKLAWGEEKIKCSQDKWVFEFYADCC